MVDQQDASAANDSAFWWNRGTPPVGAYWWVGAYQTYTWIDPANEIIGMVWAQSTDLVKFPFMQDYHTLVYEAFDGSASSE